MSDASQLADTLTLTEEILLLLGDEDGAFLPDRPQSFECALIGAVLMDLAFQDRIDTDLESLVVISNEPLGIPALDIVLQRIASSSEQLDTQSWIGILASEDVGSIREQTLQTLVVRGILVQCEQRALGLFRSVRYGILNSQPKNDAVDRIRRALTEQIPDPQDLALAALADACQMLPELFSVQDTDRDQLAQLRRMDLIGREVASTVADIQRTIMAATQAQAKRSQSLLLGLSITAGVITAMVLLSPRIPVPDQFGFSVLQTLWFEDFWQQVSGYVLLALSVMALMAGAVVRNRLVSGFVGMRRWRLAHIVIGVTCVFALVAHTGFRLGANFNLLLMVFYLATLVLGSVAGIAVGGGKLIRRLGPGSVNKTRQHLLWLHLAFGCPLLALLVIHILATYLY